MVFVSFILCRTDQQRRIQIQQKLVAVDYFMRMRSHSKIIFKCLSLFSIALISFYLMSVCYEERKPKLFRIGKNGNKVDKQHDDITISDVTITLKTTKRFHEPRVGLLLKTWLKRTLNQVRAGSV